MYSNVRFFPHFRGSEFSATNFMILKVFSPKNSAKILAFLTRNKAKLCKNLIATLVFEEKTPIFLAKIVENCRKSSKIAENCDHNIDP
jgi:hypothetical protein